MRAAFPFQSGTIVAIRSRWTRHRAASARNDEPMTDSIDNLRARRFAFLRGRRLSFPKGLDQRVVWRRLTVLVSSLWKPRKSSDVALPQWLHLMVGVSDDGLRVPGTNVRFGLDALLGTLLPGAGDALGGVTAASMMYVAWRRGAPRELMLRMLGNATVDIVFGSIPFVGDIFDLGFHSNRRNLSMLEDFLRQRSRAQQISRASAVFMFALLTLVMLLGLAVAVGLVVILWRHWQQ
jgi:hypothetical protein